MTVTRKPRSPVLSPPPEPELFAEASASPSLLSPTATTTTTGLPDTPEAREAVCDRVFAYADFARARDELTRRLALPSYLLLLGGSGTGKTLLLRLLSAGLDRHRFQCASCSDRDGCTPQVLVDVEAERRVYRLLLAYTSARNFLLFADRLLRDGRTLDRAPLTIRVLDRGTWGELRFDLAS